MAKFVTINGYTINPDHVIQIQQWDQDVGNKNLFNIILSNGKSLQILTPVYVSKRDLIDCLENCTDQNWL